MGLLFYKNSGVLYLLFFIIGARLLQHRLDDMSIFSNGLHNGAAEILFLLRLQLPEPRILRHILYHLLFSDHLSGHFTHNLFPKPLLCSSHRFSGTRPGFPLRTHWAATRYELQQDRVPTRRRLGLEFVVVVKSEPLRSGEARGVEASWLGGSLSWGTSWPGGFFRGDAARAAGVRGCWRGGGWINVLLSIVVFVVFDSVVFYVRIWVVG